jgi:hypothetical protein
LLEACQALAALVSVDPAVLVALVSVDLVDLALVPLVVARRALASVVLMVALAAHRALVDLGKFQGDNLSVRGLGVPPLSVHVVLISKSGSIP